MCSGRLHRSVQQAVGRGAGSRAGSGGTPLRSKAHVCHQCGRVVTHVQRPDRCGRRRLRANQHLGCHVAWRAHRKGARDQGANHATHRPRGKNGTGGRAPALHASDLRRAASVPQAVHFGDRPHRTYASCYNSPRRTGARPGGICRPDHAADSRTTGIGNIAAPFLPSDQGLEATADCR